MSIHPYKVALLLLIPSFSFGITRVQTADASDTLVTSLVVTSTQTPVNNDIQVMTVYTNNSVTGGVSSITQTGANWQQAVDVDNTLVESEIWYSTGVTSAGTTITINLSTTLSLVAVYAEYSGISGSSILDQIATATDIGNPPTSGTTPTTTFANELWVGALVSQAKGNAFSSPTNGFALLDTGAGPTLQYGYLEKIVGATGTASTAVSETVLPTTHVAGCMATFGVASVASATSDPTLLLMQGAD